MNTMQRRLFRAFAETGGDLTEDTQVESFVRIVESNLLLLSPKLREAVEFVWRGRDTVSYEGLVAQLTQRGIQVSVVALQQRVSRGLRLLEEAVRSRPRGFADSRGAGRPRRDRA